MLLYSCCQLMYGNAIRCCRVVNETFRSETETRPRHLVLSPRRDRDQDLPTFPPRPRRDRDVRISARDETETETLIDRDRDIFRDFFFQNVKVIINNKSSFNSTLTIARLLQNASNKLNYMLNSHSVSVIVRYFYCSSVIQM